MLAGDIPRRQESDLGGMALKASNSFADLNSDERHERIRGAHEGGPSTSRASRCFPE